MKLAPITTARPERPSGFSNSTRHSGFELKVLRPMAARN